jgi:hypothetical protein
MSIGLCFQQICLPFVFYGFNRRSFQFCANLGDNLEGSCSSIGVTCIHHPECTNTCSGNGIWTFSKSTKLGCITHSWQKKGKRRARILFYWEEGILDYILFVWEVGRYLLGKRLTIPPSENWKYPDVTCSRRQDMISPT